MFQNYLKTVIRKLARNKSTTLINASGLVLGITCDLVIFLVERFELSFDRFHSKGDRIFRINTDTHTPDVIYYTSGTRIPLGPDIRKVVGASVTDIIWIFGKEFGLLILTAFVVSAPAANSIMNNWLENFAYRIKIGPGVFIVTLLSSIALVMISVAYRSVKAATMNPVHALKYE